MTYPDITDLQSQERDVIIHLTNTGLFPSVQVTKIRKQLKKLKATKADIALIFQNREFIDKILSYYA
jgi:hypothetical protein